MGVSGFRPVHRVQRFGFKAIKAWSKNWSIRFTGWGIWGHDRIRMGLFRYVMGLFYRDSSAALFGIGGLGCRVPCPGLRFTARNLPFDGFTQGNHNEEA